MDLEKQAIEILQTFAGDEPYQLGYSGGKDSDVILHLAKKSRVPYTAVHNHTTVDAPETVYYIRKKVKQGEVVVEYPRMSMWQLIVKHKTPPTRLFRYCCAELKEQSGKGKKVVTGVRKYESSKRAENGGIVKVLNPRKDLREKVDNINFHSTKQGGVVVLNYDNSEVHRTIESCYRTSKTLINPILNWDDEFLWWYIRHEGIEINPLYNNGCPGGCTRIGCIGCPMTGKERYKQFARYPKYKQAYIRAFDRMLEYRKQCGNKDIIGWKTGQGVFDWWMEDKNIDGQYSMEFEGAELIGFKEKGRV